VAVAGTGLNIPAETRVCSSVIGPISIGHPSVVTSNWKSTVLAPLVHSKPLVRAKGIAFSRD
jgi:hypothetical protein